MKTSRLLFMVVVLLGVPLACDLGAQPPPAATPTSTPKPTPTPKIGGTVFGVQCQPDRLNILHGEAGEIKLVDVEGAGKVTDFRIGSVVPAGQGFTQSPPPNDADGWSPLPGVVQVPPRPVDGPPRTETYYINILLGGSQGAEISGGNIWCQVNVQHTVPPTPTATPTPEAPPVVYTPEDIVLAGFDLFETDSSTSF